MPAHVLHMTETASRKRQPRGTTTGGQFATEARSESSISLAPDLSNVVIPPEAVGLHKRLGAAIAPDAKSFMQRGKELGHIGDIIAIEGHPHLTIVKASPRNVACIADDGRKYSLSKSSLLLRVDRGEVHAPGPEFRQHESVLAALDPRNSTAARASTAKRPKNKLTASEVARREHLVSMTPFARECQDRTQRLLETEGLSDWTVRFTHDAEALGRCLTDSKTIELSLPHMNAPGNEDAARDTIAHEVAHAVHSTKSRITRSNAHGYEWQDIARRLGATPRHESPTSYNPEANAMAETLWHPVTTQDGREMPVRVGDIVRYPDGSMVTITRSDRSNVRGADAHGVSYTMSKPFLAKSLEQTPAVPGDQPHEHELHPMVASVLATSAS